MSRTMQPFFKSAAKAGAAALLVGVIGVFGKLAGHPLLFASLGPTAALQVAAPQLPMSRVWNVAVGQLIAVGVGFAAIYATGAAHAPPFASGQYLTFARVEAAALAIFLAIGLEFVFRASHAPGAATTLLLALGMMPPNGTTAIVLVCGIALIAVLGELMRRTIVRLEPNVR